MHKCQQTFSSQESGEPESDLSINNDGNISGTIRIFRQCADCGEEIKEYTFDIDHDVEIDEKRHLLSHKGHTLELDGACFESTEETVRTDRHGKPIRSSRYMKSLYGFSGTVEVHCADCNGEVLETVTLEDNVQASGMDELC